MAPQQPNNKVTDQEVRRACDLLNIAGIDPAYATRGQIRAVVGIGDRRARTIQEWIRRGGILSSVTTKEKIELVQSTFDTAYAEYRRWIGMSQEHGTQRPGPEPELEKVVVASDFHVPFHSKYALTELLKEAPDTSLLVIAGDLLDHWSWSRWPKSRKEAEPVEEFKEGQAVLTVLAEAFRKIVIFGGNHCMRPRKYLAERLPPEVMAYLELTSPGALNPLRLMTSGFSNVEIAEPVSKDFADFSFIWQKGDCVFSHAERYSTVPNRAVSGPVLQWLMSFARPQGIVKDFRCVVQGHTHQAGTVMADFNVLAIENGCMCPVQSYQGDAKIVSQRPPQLGWSVIWQRDGKTDIRESRFVPLPPEDKD